MEPWHQNRQAARRQQTQSMFGGPRTRRHQAVQKNKEVCDCQDPEKGNTEQLCHTHIKQTAYQV